jgi:cobyrinic acid a,c-diamide synthase
MPITIPRIAVAALKGGSGKTILSVGLIAAWREMGHGIAPFKKGPDFIDSGWLAFAADRLCYNLDPFLMNEVQILDSFLSHSSKADVALIEGNRGLYDGMDLVGCCSTAELAKLLKAPVLIAVDVTMASRTVAAVVKGCQVFDPELDIAGVILNRVAGSRQENLIRRAIETYCGTPVLGAVPKLKGNVFPERHMGLVPYQEREHAEKAVSWAKAAVKNHLQLDEIFETASKSRDIDYAAQDSGAAMERDPASPSPRIGFIRDTSFWFYYPENLEQLERLGAELVEINAISDALLPSLDALYIGGGFPETQAQLLSDNRSFRTSLKEAIDTGLPVYAECGGFMYLGERLILDDKAYPMVGALPVDFVLQSRPQGHGYTILEVERPNPYYPVGQTLKGHEFHYSKAVLTDSQEARFAFSVSRGFGVDGTHDGMVNGNLLATYTHVHAAGTPLWSRSLYRAAVDQKKSRDF